MANIPPIETTRVEFRVICRDRHGMDLGWKITDSLNDAVGFIDTLASRSRRQYEWVVYEIMGAESAKVVYRIRPLLNSRIRRLDASNGT